jgi:hypothetical protein
MRDVAQGGRTLRAVLRRTLDERECRRRNALAVTRPGFALKKGDVVTVTETFDGGEAFLLEFTWARSPVGEPGCDWMGVLSSAEVGIVEDGEADKPAAAGGGSPD